MQNYFAPAAKRSSRQTVVVDAGAVLCNSELGTNFIFAGLLHRSSQSVAGVVDDNFQATEVCMSLRNNVP